MVVQIIVDTVATCASCGFEAPTAGGGRQPAVSPVLHLLPPQYQLEALDLDELDRESVPVPVVKTVMLEDCVTNFARGETIPHTTQNHCTVSKFVPRAPHSWWFLLQHVAIVLLIQFDRDLQTHSLHAM